MLLAEKRAIARSLSNRLKRCNLAASRPFQATDHIFKLHELGYRMLQRQTHWTLPWRREMVAAEKAAVLAQGDIPVVEIGAKIRMTRRRRSLTLKEVAAATGCSES